MKKCTKCKIEKELNEFYQRKASRDGLRSDCKSCRTEYVKKNKEGSSKSNKKYYQSNKDKRKEYYQANKEKIKEYNEANKEKRKEYHKKWNQDNKKRINKLTIERKKLDPLFKLSSNLRTRTSSAFRKKGYNKNTKTQEMLGVDWEVCKAHIERQFIKGMSWDNQGDWHIDHIIPLASANTEKELKKLCHYSNLQPLWAVDNLMKSDKINGQQNKFRF